MTDWDFAAAIEQIESCNYKCVGGSLESNVAWQWLKEIASMTDECDSRGRGDAVDHPPHYTAHPSGVECIQITEHMGFNLGNAVKYIWRADLKNAAIEDLQKARWYLDREIAKRRSCK